MIQSSVFYGFRCLFVESDQPCDEYESYYVFVIRSIGPLMTRFSFSVFVYKCDQVILSMYFVCLPGM